MWYILVVALTLSGIVPVSAQQDLRCSYETCALLRVDSRILAGATRDQVGSFGIFSPPDMQEIFAASDPASRLFEVTEKNYRSGRVLEFVGLAVVFGSAFAGAMIEDAQESPSTSEWIAVGVGLGGAGLVLWGDRRLARAKNAFDEAVWWYNGSLSNAP